MKRKGHQERVIKHCEKLKIKLVLRKSKRKQGKENSLNDYEEIKNKEIHRKQNQRTSKTENEARNQNYFIKFQ